MINDALVKQVSRWILKIARLGLDVVCPDSTTGWTGCPLAR